MIFYGLFEINYIGFFIFFSTKCYMLNAAQNAVTKHVGTNSQTFDAVNKHSLIDTTLVL